MGTRLGGSGSGTSVGSSFTPGAIAQDLLPTADGSYDIGSDTNGWVDAWVQRVIFDNQGAGTDPILSSNGASRELNITGHFVPVDDVTWDVGASAQRVRSIYTQGATVYGTLTLDNQGAGANPTFSSNGSTQDINFAGFLIPSTDIQFDIGATSFRMRDYYGRNMSLAGTFTVGGVALIDASALITADLDPATDNARDLGDATHQWKDVYVGQYVRWSDALIKRDSVGRLRLRNGTDTGDAELHLSQLFVNTAGISAAGSTSPTIRGRDSANAQTTVATLTQGASAGVAYFTINKAGAITFDDAAAAIQVTLGATNGVKWGVSTDKMGFYGAAPVVRTAAYTQTYATADRTHANFTSADIGAFAGGVTGFLDAAERDNVRTQYNALRADVADLKQLVNSLIDDFQSYGLLQ